MNQLITFRDGQQVCPLGQGTYQMGHRRNEEIQALRRGIDLGLTLIDTAEMYGTEDLVGEAVCGCRDKAFIVSKVLPGNASYEGTKRACERSLMRLGTDYIDLYLLHWIGRYPFSETVRALVELQQEGKIRQFLIEKKNCIDAIIGLPSNIFYGTGIPTCILVIKKCRKEDDNILFIDASREFEKVKTQNKLRPEHIQKIVDTYRSRREIEKYSHCATLQEIKDNDYNLNIPRYVDTFEEEEPIDIHAVMEEIKELEAKRAELDKEINVYLKELGLLE